MSYSLSIGHVINDVTWSIADGQHCTPGGGCGLQLLFLVVIIPCHLSNLCKFLVQKLEDGCQNIVCVQGMCEQKMQVVYVNCTVVLLVSSVRRYSFRGAIRFLRRSFMNEGFFSLWRGNSATLVRVVPFAAIQYASHEQWKHLLNPTNDRSVFVCYRTDWQHCSLPVA